MTAGNGGSVMDEEILLVHHEKKAVAF